ncbi:cryptochrome-1-like [Amphibalanus amphitrite]|uniref:cryptochrome-1-like n=1 Tax=Amphibalanus amphitrite TaxID=1232801 RepID=UPI001C90AE8D|nr:cryptochrome-1-like [Amphibalanus amphitrite]XP_043218719.1 cryptochrome-1-like [Amphibalanus amphitrite]XP_043218721.1 cryptochrome-1-like [Amphibalanus amphitrite]XP_043218722.1 cryptochrome-1-like [Amphibalanus amphitrite]XP_043218723.1 cryptochrome-1-like [Amphibalanus amphitrite]XP_043218724.1 cryptochrome-1-like [Amphibalanus amphitrite]XP_043218725.1 cryptochrome-1-like [Amphibalanus amphitrite]XP_043218726.1 cryptochrome-1-like [Amphibalanus amphitrite]
MKEAVGVHWFRHGLRLHDNPALCQLLETCNKVYLIFIFDGESGGMRLSGYNRLAFLLESLTDLDRQLRLRGGRLLTIRGKPTDALQLMRTEYGMTHLSFEQDCEPVWAPRDELVRAWCDEHAVEIIERISHTLWDPAEVIEANGGEPPLTFSMFHQVAMSIGLPPTPEGDPVFRAGQLAVADPTRPHGHPVQLFDEVPPVSELSDLKPSPGEHKKRYQGGETRGLQLLAERVAWEELALSRGIVMPNQYCPDLLGPPRSMSAYLRHGCISVRRMYHQIQKAFQACTDAQGHSLSICVQLVWREYFYTMSVKNPYYDQMEPNPICLNINWRTDDQQLQQWKEGQTGYPFIDAAMRQLIQEGWIHHVARNATSCFLTRGDLWLNWVDGLRVFQEYLLDADWSVNAGNWMWVSSSAFENFLDTSDTISPVNYGRMFEPTGEYIRRYVPELRQMPTEYIFSPWEAPLSVQREAGCIIGKDYPCRMVNHEVVSRHNRKLMSKIAEQLGTCPPHCMPAGDAEVKHFFGLPGASLEDMLGGH